MTIAQAKSNDDSMFRPEPSGNVEFPMEGNSSGRSNYPPMSGYSPARNTSCARQNISSGPSNYQHRSSPSSGRDFRTQSGSPGRQQFRERSISPYPHQNYPRGQSDNNRGQNFGSRGQTNYGRGQSSNRNYGQRGRVRFSTNLPRRFEDCSSQDARATPGSSPERRCMRCGDVTHHAGNCWAFRIQCRNCHKYGHLAKMCMSTRVSAKF